jgi:hypothetical protein
MGNDKFGKEGQGRFSDGMLGNYTANFRDRTLGPGERRKRLIFELAALFLGLGMLVISAMNSVYSWVFLFMLFWVAGLGIFRSGKKRESFSRREECAIWTRARS